MHLLLSPLSWSLLLALLLAGGWRRMHRGAHASLIVLECLLLISMCLVYLLTTLGLGLFVSTISSTQQQAMMTSMFFFMMPIALQDFRGSVEE